MIPASIHSPSLVLFDLDNTLLGGDSDYLWGQFLVEQGLVDAAEYKSANRRFYEDYRRGCLDIHAFLRFALRPLRLHAPDRLMRLRRQFLREKIHPILLPAAKSLITCHRRRGDHLAIVTATNAFVTAPIAELFGIDTLIATEPEFKNGRFTGDVSGIPCFQEGKVFRINQWLETQPFELKRATFYSDSHNDIPLLSQVGHPVAVDPDEPLAAHAESLGWPILSLRLGRTPVFLTGEQPCQNQPEKGST